MTRCKSCGAEIIWIKTTSGEDYALQRKRSRVLEKQGRKGIKGGKTR